MKKERKKLIFFLSSFFLAKENIWKKKKERNYLYPIEILSVRMEKWENKRSTNSSLEDTTSPSMCAIWDVIDRKNTAKRKK